MVDDTKEGWVRALEHFVCTSEFYTESEVKGGLQGLFVMLDYDEFVNMTNAFEAYMHKFNFDFSWNPTKKLLKLPSGAQLSFRCIVTINDYHNFRGHEYGWVCLDRTSRKKGVMVHDMETLARASAGIDAFYLYGTTLEGYTCTQKTTEIERI